MPAQPNTSYKTFIMFEERFNIGDTILTKAKSRDYIGVIEQIRTDAQAEVVLSVRWYYRPEELPTGRLPHHGADEVVDSDHRDQVHVMTVNGKCNILTLDQYNDFMSGRPVRGTGEGADRPTPGLTFPTYFCRSFLNTKTGRLRKPLPVYCHCRKPMNPDKVMINCDTCKDWFHIECIGLTQNKANKLKDWVCPGCASGTGTGTGTGKNTGSDKRKSTGSASAGGKKKKRKSGTNW